MTRPIYSIAFDIRKDWKNVNYGAVPYLAAMAQLDKLTDKYGCDEASSIISYFLNNASSFRGPVAKVLKQELKDLLRGQ